MRRRVCAAIIRDGSILMVRHVEADRAYHTLPGGGVEPGETPEEAVVREVLEEVGLRVKVSRLLFEEHTERGPNHTQCYLVEGVGDQEPALGRDPELAEGAQILRGLAWFPLAAVADDVQVSRVIAALRE